MRVETIGNAVLYLADCRDVLPLVTADALISDPPYGIAHRRGKCSSRGKGLSLGTGGIIGDDKPFDPTHCLQYPTVILWGANWFSDKLQPGRWLVWDKQEYGGSGDFSEAEVAWQNKRGAIKIFRHMWLGVQRASQVGEARLHPTEKPVALMRWCIQQAGTPAVVFDPYFGSGTTGVAAVEMGLKFIGCEIEERYFDIACRRIEEAQRQQRLFE